MSDELEERAKMQFSYGDSKFEWIRHAIQLRLQTDPVLDCLYESSKYQERVEFVKSAVIDAVNRELERAPKKGHKGRMDRMPSEVREPNGDGNE